MSTTTPPTAPAPPAPVDPARVDPARVEAFAGEMFGALCAASTALMVSIGHRSGLFDTLAALPPSSSRAIAEAAGLDERYVREWLAAMTTARIVQHDPDAQTFTLPVEHAAVLTRAAGAKNLAAQLQFIPLLAQVEDEVVRSFAEGGGVPYSHYTRFHQVMAEMSGQIHDAVLVDQIVPLVPQLPQRLRAGIRVADVGCGRGHALNLLGEAFPASRFVG